MRLPSLALAAAFLVPALAAPAAHAQLIPSVSLGVAGGPNFSSFNEIAGTSLEGTTGFHIGVYGDVSVPFVSFRTGLYYLSAGDVETTAGVQRVSADFVTVPVDLRFSTPTPIVKAYALVGPEFRFPIGEGDALIDKSSVNIAANVGIGASFNPPLAGPNGFVELRYSQDVTGFAEDTGLASTDNRYKLSLVQLRLGVGL